MPPRRPAQRALERRLQGAPLTVGRAGRTIAIATVLVAIAGGLAIRLFDRDEFPTIGAGLWWAVQTVTTVGYGDHVPHSTGGQLVAAAVMAAGIGFLTVVTASISAAFVESARRRFRYGELEARERELADLHERLERIERLVERIAGDGRKAP